MGKSLRGLNICHTDDFDVKNNDKIKGWIGESLLTQSGRTSTHWVMSHVATRSLLLDVVLDREFHGHTCFS